MATPDPYTLKPADDYIFNVEKTDDEHGKFVTYFISSVSQISVIDSSSPAIPFPDFDDPNFDKDEAMAGILGGRSFLFIY